MRSGWWWNLADWAASVGESAWGLSLVSGGNVAGVGAAGGPVDRGHDRYCGAGAGGAAARVVVYAWVSSHDQRADLDRQVAGLMWWVTSNGHEVGQVVTEVDSGLTASDPTFGGFCRTRMRR